MRILRRDRENDDGHVRGGAPTDRSWSEPGRWRPAADAVFAIGSTLGVWPAAEIPFTAAQQGRPLVIVNQGATEMDRLASVRIEGAAGVVLPALVRGNSRKRTALPPYRSRMTLEIRPASAADIPAIHRIEPPHRNRRQHPDLVTPIEEFEEWADDPHFSFPDDSRVAVSEGEVVGFARLWHRPSDEIQSRVFMIGGVDPPHRRQGIGSSLFIAGRWSGAGRSWLPPRRSCPAICEPMAYDFEKEAIALYEKHGLVPVRYSYELIRSLARDLAGPGDPGHRHRRLGSGTRRGAAAGDQRCLRRPLGFHSRRSGCVEASHRVLRSRDSTSASWRSTATRSLASCSPTISRATRSSPGGWTAGS